jgi:SPP1 family holin
MNNFLAKVMDKMKNVTPGTWARTLVLLLALINQVLSILGHSPLPISDDQVNELVTALFTIVAAVIAWWKNNSFTAEALASDKVLRELKKGGEG